MSKQGESQSKDNTTHATANLSEQVERVDEGERGRRDNDDDEDGEAQQPENESGERGQHEQQEQQQTGNSQILPGTTQNADDATSYQRRWAELYQRLVEFKEEHGHCRVPNRYEEDPQLGYWVSTQRRQRRLMNTAGNDAVPLSRERANMLEAIGFEWSAVPASHKSWEGRFDELREYVAREGHAQVPMGYQENPRLATWVSTQRQEYKLRMKGRSSRLTDEKKKKLDSVGFVWEAPRGRRKSAPDADNTRKDDSDSNHQDGDEDDEDKVRDERKPAAMASPRDSSGGSESMRSSVASTHLTDTAGQDLAQSLLPSPPQASVAPAAGLHMCSAAAPDATGRAAPNVAQLPSAAAAIGSPALLGGSLALNQASAHQRNVASALLHASAPASVHQATLARSLSALPEDDRLMASTNRYGSQGQGLGSSGPVVADSASQNLLHLMSNLSSQNVAFPGGLSTNLSTFSDGQSSQLGLLDQIARQQQQQQASELFQHTVLNQLIQHQASEQQRHLQQLEALRSLQALPSPASSLQLLLALQSNPLLQHSNASTSTMANLSVQNLTEQQPYNVTMEGLQQAQLLLAARQLGNEEVVGRRPPQEPDASTFGDEKTTDQEDSQTDTGTDNRRRPADPPQFDRDSKSAKRF